MTTSIFIVFVSYIVGVCFSVKTCSNLYSCANETITSYTQVYCRGFGSCRYGYLQGSTLVSCQAGLSCMDASYIHGWDGTQCVGGFGYLSMAWSDTVEGATTNSVYLQGEGAGYNVKYLTGKSQTLLCNGYRACANTTIYDSENIDAAASLALHNTIIHSSNTYTTNIKLSGFLAGYNTKIYCKYGNKCNVTCLGNGCDGTYYICERDNITNATNGDCIVSCNDEEGVTCPLFSLNSQQTDLSEKLPKFISQDNETASSLIPVYDYSHQWDYKKIIVDSKEIICNESATNYSEPGAITKEVYSDMNICCYATDSCTSSIFIALNGALVNVYVFGGGSADGANIELANDIYGFGSNSFEQGIVSVFNRIFARGTSSFYQSTIMYGNKLFCSGSVSCKNSEISSVYYIYATGYQALRKSLIKTNGRDINIFLMGYDAAYNLNVECGHNSDDVCKIYCINDACININDTDCCDVYYSDTLIPTPGPTMMPTQPTLIPSAIPTANPQLYPTMYNGSLLWSSMYANDTGSIENTGDTGGGTETTQDDIAGNAGGDSASSASLYWELIDGMSFNLAIPIIGIMFGSLLYFISRWTYGKNRKQAKNAYDAKYNKMTLLLTNLNDNGEMSKMSENGASKKSSTASEFDYSSTVDYERGISAKASHFVIFTILFAMYDFYTDLIYIWNLIDASQDLKIAIIVFIGTMVLEICLNLYFIIKSCLNEIKYNNYQFNRWLTEHIPVPIIFGILSLVEIKIASTIFISQLFGYSLFYAPLLRTTISKMNQNAVYLIVCVHIPQLIIQCYVVIDNSSIINFSVGLAMIVTTIDVLYAILTAIAWCGIHEHHVKKTMTRENSVVKQVEFQSY